MSATHFRTEDAAVTISDAGRQQYEAEQRNAQAEILMWTTAAAVVAVAGLVLKQILGG